MNHFTLFAHGDTFDVDAYVASTTLQPDLIWRRGDQRRNSCVESLHETSGVEFVLGDGLAVPLPEQEAIAAAYLEAHREELQSLARAPGADTFILGLQYCASFESNVLGFCLGPSALFMWHCLDVGVRPVYYVTLDKRPDDQAEDA